ncbi:hypothetical protein DCOP10_114173 [Armatimonadetes bacterium DC]|nr:hypothetical protein DCOP10_114173 [Armatimonadetes bacterium DC]
MPVGHDSSPLCVHFGGQGDPAKMLKQLNLSYLREVQKRTRVADYES